MPNEPFEKEHVGTHSCMLGEKCPGAKPSDITPTREHQHSAEDCEDSTVAFGWLLTWAQKYGVSVGEFYKVWERAVKCRESQAYAKGRQDGAREGKP